MSVVTAAELLAQFRRQVRLTGADADPGHVRERDGLIRRSYPLDPAQPGAMIESPEGLGESEAEIEATIDRQIVFFEKRGQSVEWKTYGDDQPADLVERLRRKGFVVGDIEVVLLGECAALSEPVDLPDGITVREFETRADWERMRALMDEVWGTEKSWVNDVWRREHEQHPMLFRPILAEETDGARRVVSYAALRLTPGVDFAGLWGGTTHPAWRGRGLYRALTAYRAQLAMAADHPYVRVDTSPDSRPILTRLGLAAATTTTPCVRQADAKDPDARGSSR